jgi:hypothetical protein
VERRNGDARSTSAQAEFSQTLAAKHGEYGPEVE